MDNLSIQELEQLLDHVGSAMDIMQHGGYTIHEEDYANLLMLNMRIFRQIGKRYREHKVS